MATVRDIKIKDYCDTIFTELSDIKKRILNLAERMIDNYGMEDETLKNHGRHLCEIADFIDWKLQLIGKVCPHDWKGFGEEAESTVAVPAPEGLKETDVSGGYIGG